MSQINKKIFMTALVDFLPVLVFIVFFELFNFMDATIAIIVATFISLLLASIKEKRVPVFMLVMSVITLVFGYITIIFDSSNVLKVKDTFYDFTAGSVLLVGLIVFKRLIMKDFFKHVLSYTEEGWKMLTWGWVSYFYIGGIVNEIIRHVPGAKGDALWVHYKIIHIPITILLAITSIYLANKKYKLDILEKDSVLDLEVKNKI